MIRKLLIILVFTINLWTFGQENESLDPLKLNCSQNLDPYLKAKKYKQIVEFFEALSDSCLAHPIYIKAAGMSYFVLGEDDKAINLLKNHKAGHMTDAFLGPVFLAYPYVYEYKKKHIKRFFAKRRIRKTFPGGKTFCTRQPHAIKFSLLEDRFNLKADSAGVEFIKAQKEEQFSK